MKKFAKLLVWSLCVATIQAQDVIKIPAGYTNDIGHMVFMLDDLKKRVEYIVKDLNQEEVDFLLDDKANRIGAIIYHLAATEAYYQVYTFEKRSFNEEEKKKWKVALNLGAVAREELTGKSIQYYLNIYDEVRDKTKALLKTKNDKWFKKRHRGMSNHWAWFHVMEHQANHMGQLALIVKRF
ncbi:MAG: DUF664 domain-containing protein [Flavobacteriaceae bacterium]|nr:DUF664 domain-containing protein [Flavobacteriaceae bacterium]